MLPLILIHWRKADEKLSGAPCVRTENRWKIPLFSKYSVRIVRTRWNILIYMLKKFFTPITSDSVTSGQADVVFCQLFYCVYRACCFWTLTFSVVMKFLRITTVQLHSHPNSLSLLIIWHTLRESPLRITRQIKTLGHRSGSESVGLVAIAL